MAATALAAANVYVSHGAVRALVAGGPTAKVLDRAVAVTCDAEYQRTGITLAGPLETVEEDVLALVGALFPRLSLASHSATHPRIGVIDNIVVAPIEAAWASDTRLAASRLAKTIAENVPKSRTVVYSSAVPLASIRRRTPYFSPSALSGALAGDGTHAIDGLEAYGLAEADPEVGLTCVGSVPWVTNFNVPLRTPNLTEARTVAKAIRTRGGGAHALQSVEAVGLVSRSGQGIVEVACNLLDISKTTTDDVQRAVEQLSPHAMTGYVVGASWESVCCKARALAAQTNLPVDK